MFLKGVIKLFCHHVSRSNLCAFSFQNQANLSNGTVKTSFTCSFITRGYLGWDFWDCSLFLPTFGLFHIFWAVLIFLISGILWFFFCNSQRLFANNHPHKRQKGKDMDSVWRQFLPSEDFLLFIYSLLDVQCFTLCQFRK